MFLYSLKTQRLCSLLYPRRAFMLSRKESWRLHMDRLHYGPYCRTFVIVALVVFFPRELAAQLQRYSINPGGQYTYLPSP